MKKIWFVFFVLLLSACGTSESGSNFSSAEVLPTVPPEYAGLTNPLGGEAAERGAVTFQSTCASCHGEQGYGNGVASASLNPPPKNLVELKAQVDDDYLYWKISDGDLGTAMLAWKGILTEEQIWELVSFIRTLK
jgi:mono/diheme cytochrome c family protein